MAWSSLEDKKLRDLWESGDKIDYIACVLGKSFDAVHHRIGKLKLPRRRAYVEPIFTREQVDTILRMWGDGVRSRHIADAIGVSERQVKHKICRLRSRHPDLVPLRSRIGPKRNPIIEEIKLMVCDEFRVSRENLIGPSRLSIYSGPRHIAMALCRRITGLSLEAIAKEFNRRDHTTVLNAVDKTEHLCPAMLDGMQKKFMARHFKEAAE